MTMSDAHQAPNLPRRSQALRTAHARERIIEGAISALHEKGYAGATLSEIASRAGLTKGAVLHHFADRVAVLAAVVDDVFVREMSTYEAAFEQADPKRRLIEVLLETAWKIYQQPPALAVLDIWMATRSHPDLASVVLPVFEQIRLSGEARMTHIMEQSKAPSGTEGGAWQTMMLATLRGLALEYALGRASAADDAAQLLIAITGFAKSGAN
jgi:AcrR family transcriptional regulator